MFNLAGLEVESSDARRKIAAKFAAQGHLPADAAAAATLVTVPHRARRRSEPAASFPTVGEHDSGLPAWRRRRVLVPFVEPNVHSWLRTILLQQAPVPEPSADGILTTAWAHPAQRAEATRAAYDYYLKHHSVVTEAPRIGMGLDSWHHPLALVPVRHTFADGSPSVTTWVAADGTARVFAARRALAKSTSAWIGEHPWTDPGTVWPTDVVALRDVAARARRHVTAAGGDPEHDWSLASPWLVDWADLVLASPSDPAAFDHQIGLWAFLEHKGSDLDDDLDEAGDAEQARAHQEMVEVRDLLSRIGGALADRDAASRGGTA